MKKQSGGLLRKSLMLAIGLFLALPMVAMAQQRDGGWNTVDQRREDLRRARQHRRDDRRDNRRDARRGRDWDRYDNYGGSSQLRQTALNAGYNEGIKEGRKERQRGERFNYQDEGKYQSATTDYSSRLGNRELYRRYYRQGYANGYEDGYRGY
jgi:hypothetical protein